MKYYTFMQNNSGGYFVEDEAKGISEIVIIQAESSTDAWEKLEDIGDSVSGFWNYCSCCGQRWSSYVSDEGDTPQIYEETIEEYLKDSWMRTTVFVHHSDNSIEKFTQ